MPEYLEQRIVKIIHNSCSKGTMYVITSPPRKVGEVEYEGIKLNVYDYDRLPVAHTCDIYGNAVIATIKDLEQIFDAIGVSFSGQHGSFVPQIMGYGIQMPFHIPEVATTYLGDVIVDVAIFRRIPILNIFMYRPVIIFTVSVS